MTNGGLISAAWVIAGGMFLSSPVNDTGFILGWLFMIVPSVFVLITSLKKS